MIKTDIIYYRVKRRCKELLLDNFVLAMCCLLLSVFCLVSETKDDNNPCHILKHQTAEVVNNGIEDTVCNAPMAREELTQCSKSIMDCFEFPTAITVNSSVLSNVQYRGYRGVTGLCQSAITYLKESRSSGRSVKVVLELPKVAYVYMTENLRI